MSHAQGKPAISPSTVLFLWAFMAIISCGIALQSILSTSDETMTSLFSWDRMPQFVETRFTPAVNAEQQMASNDGANSSAELATRVTELNAQLETIARTVNGLQLDNSRIQDNGVETFDRIARLESSLDFVTGSLPTDTGRESTGNQNTGGPVDTGSGDISVSYAPLPLDRESGNGSELLPGAVQRTEFAVVVARHSSQAALSRIWTLLREEQGGLFDGLTPRIVIESDPHTGTQLALLAGPLRNAQTAIELCARLALPSSSCQPIQYGGNVLPTLTSGLQVE